jgi:predicted permease
LVGGALGVLLALFALKTIVTTIASQLPRASEISLDAKVLAFTIALSLLAGVLAGLLPALRLSKTNVNDALKQGTRGGTEFGGNRTRSVLVTAEVALSLMLLVCAGLMLRSLSKLHNVDPGFDPKGVLAVIPAVSRTTFSGPAQQVGFFQQVLANARALPGVESAALADDLPMTGGSNQPIAIEGRPAQAMADQPEVSVRIVSPGYLKTMRIPVIRGRDFGTEEDAPNGTAILISEAMARRFWPNEDPVGKHLRLTFFPDRMREIVGVVGDIKDDGLNQPATAMLYTPFAQITAPPTEAWRSFPVWVVIRASGSPAGMLSSLNGAIHQVSAQMPILSSTTMDETVGQTLAQDRFTTMLLGTFAGLALFLAAIGIYSVLAYSVRRRVREIGIRMALGARLADVLRMVMIEGMKPTSVGLALGIAGSLALGRVLSTLIFGVKPTDLITFAGVSGLLLTVGLFACLLPAYRATQIQPMKTLRDE